jgi:hypothetical protein
MTDQASRWRALYDFVGQGENQLSFQKGEIFTVTQQHKGGWLTAVRGAEVGYVPSNYLELIPKGKPCFSIYCILYFLFSKC